MASEGFLTLPQAAKLLPGKPHISTLHRWRLSGCRGVRLRTKLLGGRRYTRLEWLDQFDRQLNADDELLNSEPVESHAVDADERVLQSAGI